MAIIDTIREYVNENVIGKESVYDTLTEPPQARFDSFHSLGINNWWLPPDVGGRGVSLQESVGIVSELAYGDGGLAFSMLISILGTTFIEIFGTSEQRARLLGPLAREPRYAALAASEHEAGSELLRITTVAEEQGGKYALSGRKAFCTNAAFADFVVVVAKVAGLRRDTYKGFVVEKGQPGFEVLRRWRMVGLRSSATYELQFDNCLVEPHNVIETNGLRALEVALNASRILISSMGIGIAKRGRDLSLQYARTKEIDGQRLTRHPTFAAKLGQIEMQIEAMRSVCVTAARDYDDLRRDHPTELQRLGALKTAMVAKMFAGQSLWSAISALSESFGGLGYTEDSPIGKLVRDARIISIVEGGDDVLRRLLFRHCVVDARGVEPS